MIILPRSNAKKREVLQRIAKRFKEGKTYTEAEVNGIIRSCDVEDHVLVRRELVNFNFLAKDTAQGIYWLKQPQE